MTSDSPRGPLGAGPTRFGVIIGAMKSGTTSVFDLLSQHPQIAAASRKEADFFSDHAAPTDDWSDYLDLWAWDSKEHRIALDASVAYAKAPWVPDVPKRMASVPGVDYRFLYILRHPLRRIESQVRHSLYAGWGQPLDEGLTDDLLGFSRYASQLDAYLEYFTREQILLVTLEEFTEAPGDVLARCCRHFGVDPDFGFEGMSEPRNTGEFFSVRPGVRSFLQRFRLDAIARALLPRKLQQAIRGFLGRSMAKEDALDRYRLNGEEEKQLLVSLQPELDRLAIEFGVEVERYWTLPVSRDS